MKKKLLALILATTMSMGLVACGGSEEVVTEEVAEEATEKTAGDYTEEQSAFVDEFNSMVDEYNVAIDAVNANEDLSTNQELVDMLNTVTASIDEAAEIISDPANLTDEVMESYREAFANTYELIDSINAYIGEEVATDER